jgi:hypothetical protein
MPIIVDNTAPENMVYAGGYRSYSAFDVIGFHHTVLITASYLLTDISTAMELKGSTFQGDVKTSEVR